MGGGLMQLVAYGAQDIYLTGNPQITFFKVVYRRHTNFSMEEIAQDGAGTVEFGNEVNYTISRNGDLIHKMYFHLKANSSDFNISNSKKVSNFGNTLLKEVEIEIGGQKIDKHYSHWLSTWSDLTQKNYISSNHTSRRITPFDTLTAHSSISDTYNPTLYQRMSDNYFENDQNVLQGEVNVNEGLHTTYHIPLQFWFNRNPGLALPLIALQYHEVKIKILFEKYENLINGAGTSDKATKIRDGKFYVQYILC